MICVPHMHGEMPSPGAIIARIVVEPIIRGEYLHRNEVLFSEDEWTWSEDQSAAFVFGSPEVADEFAHELTDKGTRCHALILSPSAAKIEAQHRRADAEANSAASCQEERRERHQAMLERNHLD